MNMGMDSEPKMGLPGNARSQLGVMRALLRGEPVMVIDAKGAFDDAMAQRPTRDDGPEE